jgi:hypothetical protein
MAIFDINNAKGLFFLINRTMKDYCSKKEKDAVKLLFLIMALNHLREWIEPGYNKKDGKWPVANTLKKQFSKKVYMLPEFGTIRKLSNNTKHIISKPPNTDSEHGLPIDEWDDFDSVASFDNGPAIHYLVDGVNVINILDTVINFYKTEWFDKNK